MKAQKLTELFPIQATLDEAILVKHPIQEKENRLQKVKVALLVELGEAMNEYRKFKFWSTDQEPRTKVNCKSCKGTGEIWIGDFKKDCFDCDEDNKQDLLLEELVDCLHFLLSIGLRLGVQDELLLHDGTWFLESPEEAFIYLMATDSTEWYSDAFGLFVSFYTLLGYKTEDLYNGYFEKNKINHKRQEEGY